MFYNNYRWQYQVGLASRGLVMFPTAGVCCM